MKKLLLAGAAALGLAIAPAAQAALVDVTTVTIPGGLPGNAAAIFVFTEAADTSTLSWSQDGFATTNLLFNNNSDPIGTIAPPSFPVPLGFGAPGNIAFRLDNQSFPQVLDTGVQYLAPSTNTLVYAAKASFNYADFGQGALPAAAAAAIATVQAARPGSSIVFIGFEDRVLCTTGAPLNCPTVPDFDYNDLIYAFDVTVANVPAPAALGLFGMGLLGLAGVARRRRT
ncbi:PEP-CTERM sorting domain-containing protein [Falsiroseomonas oryzae]|uniref:PEP-CTERM sorting domain-containing protein n=1 Tax=Falsiroseomonas oryzae TaxID=2766473 RepID=UPI0022EABF7D|nr:PEP-CTERM sorting domain-containing protein [Roseomonas sp. MO-31]